MPRLTRRGHLYAADEGKRPHAIRRMELGSGDVSVSQHRLNDAALHCALQQARRSWRNLDAGPGNSAQLRCPPKTNDVVSLYMRNYRIL